jgi:hypothetical protein
MRSEAGNGQVRTASFNIIEVLALQRLHSEGSDSSGRFPAVEIIESIAATSSTRPCEINNQELQKARSTQLPVPNDPNLLDLLFYMESSSSIAPHQHDLTCYPYKSCHSTPSTVASSVKHRGTLVVLFNPLPHSKVPSSLSDQTRTALQTTLNLSDLQTPSFATARRSIWPRYDHMTLINPLECPLRKLEHHPQDHR